MKRNRHVEAFVTEVHHGEMKLESDLELCMTKTSRYYGMLDQITPSDYIAAMVRACAIAFFLMCLAAPVWATEAESFDPDQPFNQALTTSALRSLLNQALDRLEDHVEISGNFNSDDTKGDQGKHLRFKFFPEGKSKSDQHFTAEGWFGSSPESGQYDWRFQFKQPDDRSKKHPPPQIESPL
ncbi:MAG: hypothetical protein JSS39_00050 [Nitrospira sp.]|nr:hypothetical protein [Nitrospira sp.]